MPDIRVMTGDDINLALRLCSREGWDYSDEDFRHLLSFSPGGCFIARIGETDVGMVLTTPYGADCGFIGCLIVEHGFRGRGIGNELLFRAVDHLRSSGVEAVYLEAVPRAVPLYERNGFTHLWDSFRFFGTGATQDWDTADCADTADRSGGSPLEVCPYNGVYREGIVELDRRLTEIDRTAVLNSTLDRFGDRGYVCHRDGAVLGYLMVRPASRGFRIGPWVCEPSAPDVSWCLFRAAGRDLKGEKISVGLPATNTVGVNILKKNGFLVGFTCSRMRLGANGPDGDPAAIFALASAEKG